MKFHSEIWNRLKQVLNFNCLVTFESTIPADSWPPFGEQLRLQVHRDLVGSGPPRGRASGRHSRADQAESAAESGPGDQATSQQVPQADPEALARLQEENQELRKSLCSLTFFSSRPCSEKEEWFNQISIARACRFSVREYVRYLREIGEDCETRKRIWYRKPRDESVTWGIQLRRISSRFPGYQVQIGIQRNSRL